MTSDNGARSPVRTVGVVLAAVAAIPATASAGAVHDRGTGDAGATTRPVLDAGGVWYELGEPGDVAVVGDSDCDGLRTPSIYRRSTGQVFEFDSWADGLRSLPARTSAVVGGRAEVVVDRAGCERLVVGRTAPFGASGRYGASEGE